LRSLVGPLDPRLRLRDGYRQTAEERPLPGSKPGRRLSRITASS
jgi:hypothetical protein